MFRVWYSNKFWQRLPHYEVERMCITKQQKCIQFFLFTHLCGLFYGCDAENIARLDYDHKFDRTI